MYVFVFFVVSETFPKYRKYFGIFGVFVKQIVILIIGFGFCVFNSIWKHRIKIFFDPQNRPPQIDFFSKKCEQFSYGAFGGIFLGFKYPRKCSVRELFTLLVFFSICLGSMFSTFGVEKYL